MQGLLASPRRRRRIARAGLAVAAVAAVAGVVILDPGGVDPPRESAPEPSPPAAQQPQQPLEPLRLTRESRRELDSTVRRFVATAVARRDLDEAWRLASPEMRAGVSRRDWNRGDLPVLPYPADAVGAVDWSVGYVEADAVVVDVMIQPKRGSGERVQVYSVQLSQARDRGRWLVDSWIPAATLGGDAPQARPAPERGGARPPLAFDDARLSAWWFLVPAFFLALLVLTPVVLAVRGIRTRRRADRAYREWPAG